MTSWAIPIEYKRQAASRQSRVLYDKQGVRYDSLNIGQHCPELDNGRQSFPWEIWGSYILLAWAKASAAE